MGALRCVNNAPLFAVNTGNVFSVLQGCCNSWTCPRCGEMRARHEYGRIVHGCGELSVNHELYFITITTRGSGLSVRDAHNNYLLWTNRLLSTLRANSKKRGLHWCYAQVTEHQKRGHPHSHFISTYHPDDLTNGKKRTWHTDSQGKRVVEYVDRLNSDYLRDKCVSAGLGKVYDISNVRSVEGTSRYIAKYLFKDGMFTDDFPKNWRRVRYSHSFPKLPERETNAFILLEKKDWERLAKEASFIKTREEIVYTMVCNRLNGDGIIVKPPLSDVVNF